ncbi:hypothetical protein G9A89_017070 [Geosiphon pyriformis]|nr:hypothetical protein G9A89_017070 [Geosiphon pyriformis]
MTGISAMAISPPTLETFQITLTPQGVAVIAFNRPKRLNALIPKTYENWIEALDWASTSPEVKVVVFTGNGKFYSSGVELIVQPTLEGLSLEEKKIFTRKSLEPAEKIANALIQFPKLLIAAVNGPAVGYAVTTLGLFDVIYSVPEATFHTPFMQLGFCAEGCSSYLFPKIFGYSVANEFLLMGRKFTASELERLGFISRIIPSDNFLQNVLELANAAAKYPYNAMIQTKNLIRVTEREELVKVNKREIDVLVERWLSDESKQAIQEFVKASQQKRNNSKL